MLQRDGGCPHALDPFGRRPRQRLPDERRIDAAPHLREDVVGPAARALRRRAPAPKRRLDSVDAAADRSEILVSRLMVSRRVHRAAARHVRADGAGIQPGERRHHVANPKSPGTLLRQPSSRLENLFVNRAHVGIIHV